MKTWAVLFAAAGLLVCAAVAADPPMVTRVYPVLPSLGEILNMASGVVEKAKTFQDKDVRKFFEELEVPFPPAASVRYSPSSSRLVVRSSPSSLEVLEQKLTVLNVTPPQVELDVSYVAFDRKAIEQVARASDRAAPSGEEVQALWREGKGRMLGTSKVVTRSDINAQVKGVREVIYPSKFTWAGGTGEVAGARGPVPDGFETRDVGLIEYVTSSVGADGRTIEMTMVTELAELLGEDVVGVAETHEGGPGAGISLRQPLFHSRNVTTSVALLDGATMVLAGMPGVELGEITYIFLTARLLNAEGQPLRAGAPGAPTRGSASSGGKAK